LLLRKLLSNNTLIIVTEKPSEMMAFFYDKNLDLSSEVCITQLSFFPNHWYLFLAM